MTDTVRLKLPLLAAAQAQKHVTINEALTLLDLLTGVIPALSRAATSPPGGDSDGDIYILPGSGTGDWTGYNADDVVMMIDGGWRRTLPSQGMVAAIADEGGQQLIYDGAAWTDFGSFTPKGAWDSGTTYAKRDLVEHGGYAFISKAGSNLNHAPDTAPASGTYWMYWPAPAGADGTDGVDGADGADGAPGSSDVVGTSATSVDIDSVSVDDEIAFTIVEADRGWGIGARLSAASAADPVNYLAGTVVAYAANTLTLKVTDKNGSGTHTDWTFNITGKAATATVDATSLATTVHGAAAKTTPVDADELLVLDSAASYVPKKTTVSQLQAVIGGIVHLGTGVALPGSDIGPIWHDDYGGLMTWQVFNANGASYTGYASVDIGLPRLDGQPTPRTGWLKANGASVSATTYAALYNKAKHIAKIVSTGSWVAGEWLFGDNGDGTFKLPEVRGEFFRVWDDGRGVDIRAFGSHQDFSTQDLFAASAASFNNGSYTQRVSSPGWTSAWLHGGGASSNAAAQSSGVPIYPMGTGVTRPRNVALLGAIKF